MVEVGRQSRRGKEQLKLAMVEDTKLAIVGEEALFVGEEALFVGTVALFVGKAALWS